MRQLVDAFYRERSIAEHHIASYNDFIQRRLQRVINTFTLNEEEPERGYVHTDIEGFKIKLGRIAAPWRFLDEGRDGSMRQSYPIRREADGSSAPMTPMEARLRNLTYEAPLYLEFFPVLEGIEYEPEWVEIGMLPTMVRSTACNITQRNLEWLELSGDLGVEEYAGRTTSHYTNDRYVARVQDLGEDPLDPGGYFIVNGTERALVSMEDLAPNRVMVERVTRYGRDVEVAKVFSQHEGTRSLVTVEKKRDGTLHVELSTLPNPIPLIIVMRSLGLETDEELVENIGSSPSMLPVILANLELAQDEGVTNTQEAIEYLGKKVAGGQAREYRRKRAEQVMDRTLLPHLGQAPEDRIKKAVYLGRMALKVLELAEKKIPEDDKDHYMNKRIKLAGDLMEDLFRSAFLQLAKDIKYQVERAHARGREPRIQTCVRSDVLSQRLLHALSTGNWVGGRAGVSQLLDRTSNMSAVSHLRRVISPLTRSQPHFEARDLHATQWGRLCPNETPEGPNCGLVKNLALLAEVTEGIGDEVEVRNRLFELGVRQIPRRTAASPVSGGGE